MIGTMQDRIENVGQLLIESLGVRTIDLRPQLSPVPTTKDMGRQPLRGFGRVEIERVIASVSPRSLMAPSIHDYRSLRTGILGQRIRNYTGKDINLEVRRTLPGHILFKSVLE